MTQLDEASRALILQEAGLEVLGSVAEAGGVEPASAWKRVISGNARPTVVVDDEEDDYLDEVDRQWRRLAGEHGVLAEDGSFLISTSGSGSFGLPWASVRITPKSRLAQLTANPGEPEFVTMANDGHVIVGVTTEEDGVWLIVTPLP